MRNRILIILYSTVLVFLCGCKDIQGEAYYYPEFLWTDSNNIPIYKTLVLDWNDDSQNDPQTDITLKFCDNNGCDIPKNELKIFADDTCLDNNTITIKSKIDSIKLKFEFSPEAEDGVHQGFIKVINTSNLVRVDNTYLAEEKNPDIYQWTFQFTKLMNPLAKLIMWIGIIIGSILLIWLCILKKIIYPQFPKFRKQMLIRKNGQIIQQSNIILTGARKAIVSNRTEKQSILNRIFCGKIAYIQNDLFTEPLIFVPKRKNAMVLGLGYQSDKNPIPRNGKSIINNSKLKIQITLQ